MRSQALPLQIKEWLADGPRTSNEVFTRALCAGWSGWRVELTLQVLQHSGDVLARLDPAKMHIILSLPEAVSAPCSVAKGSTLPETDEQSREVALPQSQDEAQSD